MKNIRHEYSCFLMKTEEMNKQMWKNHGCALPKLLNGKPTLMQRQSWSAGPLTDQGRWSL